MRAIVATRKPRRLYAPPGSRHARFEPIETAPCDRAVELKVADAGGAYELVGIPFRLTTRGFVNARTGAPLAAHLRVVGWRDRAW